VDLSVRRGIAWWIHKRT